MKPITINNIGPLAYTTIPVPAQGGIVVLRGRNGVGKTVALKAVQSTIAGGKDKPPLKDCATRGEVTAFGARLTVGKSVKRSGELEVVSLESRIHIADLVDPQIIDPARADAERIRALIGLSQSTMAPEDFYGFPSEALAGLNLDDPLTACAELKRRLNGLALSAEKCRDASLASAEALRDSVLNIEIPSVIPEETALNAALETVIRAESAIEQATKEAKQRKQQAEQARAAMAGVEVPDTAALNQAVVDAREALMVRHETVESLKAALRTATEQAQEAAAAFNMAEQRANSAIQQAAIVMDWQSQITAAERPGPSADEIAAAHNAVIAAREALSDAADARRAKAVLAQAQTAKDEAEQHSAMAVEARRKAKFTDDILSEKVADLAGCPLSVADGRLVIKTDKRGWTYYSDLSMGERWRVAMDIAIAAVGVNGLIVIPQEAWEGLDPQNRAALNNQAIAAGVVVLTAECSGDDELTPRIFESETA